MSRRVHCPGKRKRAIARSTVKEGKGSIRINSIPLDIFQTELTRAKIRLTLMLASDYVDLDKINIDVKVGGGGAMGQADAISCSIARSLVEWSENDDLLSKYQEYDRTMIAGDHRLTEPHKPGQSSKGPRHRRQKSYR